METPRISIIDVENTAKEIGLQLTKAEIEKVIERYRAAEEQDPSGEWYLIIEQVIHEVIGERETNIVMETKKKYVEIVRDKGNIVVKRIDVTGYSDKRAEKVETGVGINLNHNDFTTRIEEYDKEMPKSDEL